jgi:hypothetical protein
MVIYKQLHSILLKDGNKYAVDLSDWAQKTLSTEEHTQFLADFAEFREFYQDLERSGKLIIELVTEIIPDINITAVIGKLYTFTESRVEHEKYALWQARFAADPNVTYNPEVLQS